MISRPDSIAWIAGIVLVVIITIGFAVSDVTETGASDPVHEAFFTQAYAQAENQTGLVGAGSDATEALGGEEGTNTEPSETSILAAGFKSLLNLGKVWNSVKVSMNAGTGILSINPIYWLIGMALMAITFAVIVYTWIRGN